jgi:hypothetical protein
LPEALGTGNWELGTGNWELIAARSDLCILQKAENVESEGIAEP